ncbi:MAG: hypothetical protein Q9198_001458 [Flavoplaca austrocitrina]
MATQAGSSMSELSIARTRPRGDTVSLLQSTSENIDTIIECPGPENSKKAYTVPRLQKSLAYAHNCLQRRDLSPRSKIFYELFKDMVKDAIQMDDNDESRERILGFVQVQEDMIVTYKVLRPITSPPSQEVVELQKVILQLRQLEYFARYGDYFKEWTTLASRHAKTQRLPGWELIRSTRWWSNIANDLKAEDEARAKFDASPVKTFDAMPGRPTRNVIVAACKDLNVDEDLMLFCVKEYGMRNEVVHRSMDELIGSGNFPILRKTLLADQKDLFCTFGDVRPQEELIKLSNIIQLTIEKYFIMHDPVVDDTWGPSDALVAARAEMQSDASKANEKVARQLKSESKTTSKRMASTEVPRGAEADVENQRPRLVLDAIGFKCAASTDTTPLSTPSSTTVLPPLEHLVSLPVKPSQSAESLAESSTAFKPLTPPPQSTSND